MTVTGWAPMFEPFSADELPAWEAGGYGARAGLGDKPAVLVVDVVRSFTGYQGESQDEGLVRFRQACGPVAWEAVPNIQRLLTTARRRGMPVLYTRPAETPTGGAPAARRGKNRRAGRESSETRRVGCQIVPEVAPEPGETVIEKSAPSGFFGTELAEHLSRYDVDHLIVTGSTTSGCIRATVYDGFSHGYGISIPAECVFDRFRTSHRVNLFDMNAKFADVIPLADLLEEMDERFSARQ